MSFSVITLAELRHGVDRLAAGKRRSRLDEWLRVALPLRFEGRVLAIEAQGSTYSPVSSTFFQKKASVDCIKLVGNNMVKVIPDLTNASSTVAGHSKKTPMSQMKYSMIVGVIAAALAAFSWSLSFIVPFVIGDYSLFDFALVEFVVSGVLSAGLLWRNAPAVRKLKLADWISGCSLGLIGYVGYFLAVMGAAVYAGPVIAPAFLGLVPVALGVAGNLRQRTVSWTSLVLPLSLAAIGLFLVNGSGFLQAGGLQSKSLVLGVPLAILAVTCWTLFGLLNQSALAQRPDMDVGVWTALIMAGAGISMLIFLPIGLLFGLFEIPRLGLHWDTAAPLLMWGTGLAVCANFGGATAWTFASRRLPVALAAQMITMEPISATILGLVVHHRRPSVMEVLGVITLLVGVVVAIGIFSKSSGTGNGPALGQSRVE